ncbi:MAG TPA: long-chain fatty acid--CoA ligase [Solimonas sp.]|nr:long-chain fatty acid--CoA ligase [Solimonas sp.]
MQLDIIARRAELSPQRPAVQFRGRWYSYAELDQRASRLAARLRALSIAKGDRVSIMAANHLAHFDLVHAAPRLGYIYAPFNFRLSAAEQKGLGEYIAPKLMLHDAKNESMARATGAPLQPLDAYEEWLAAAEPAAPTTPCVGPEDVAMILFTGGSTGLPKGAMLAHRQLFFNAVNTAFSWGVTGEDCVIQATPAFHAAFNVFGTPLMHVGGRVVMLENFEPGEYLRIVARERATVLFMVPTMFQMLAEHPDFRSADLSSVRWAICGGAPCPETVQARFAMRGIRFRQGFGMTEAGVNCFTVELDDAERRPGTVGKPMLHAEAVIRDAEGQPVARGEVGELTLRGPHLFLGYYQRPEETAKCLHDGWLWTGDLARQDAEGFFYIVGRSKEMYISGGENVYPVEVESAIYEQPEVAECAVVGVPHERWGETGLAALALKPGCTLSAEELRGRLKQRLAGYKVPGHVLFLDALPKSGAGKILKPEIRKLFEGR